jgi:hypothetical protein
VSDSEGPPPAEETTVDAGVGTAIPLPLPIGGLLWLPGVYLVLVMLLMASQVEDAMRSTTKGSSVPTGVFLIHLANLAVSLFLTIKFFQRRRYVPLLIMGWSLFAAVTWVGQTLPARAIIYKMGSVALIVSYFSLSKRVKRTFLL